MESIITSFLLQHQSVSLPGIGTLRLVPVPARPDFLEKSIQAPLQQWSFAAAAEDDSSPLVNYISFKKQISNTDAKALLDDFCGQLNTGNNILLPTIGTLAKNAEGILSFTATATPGVFTQPVLAERVLRPEAEHTMLVGDKETTNTAMTEYYSETPVAKSRWWIWALVLGIAGLAAAFFHFSQYGFSGQATGNIVRP